MDVAGINITASRFVVLSREKNLGTVQLVDQMCKNLSLECEETIAIRKLQKSEQGVPHKAKGESSKPGVGSQLTMHHTEEENKPCDGAPVTDGNGSRLTMHHTEEENKPCDGAPVTEGIGSLAQLSDTAAGFGPWMQVAKNGKVQRPITKTRGLFHVEMLDEHGRQELEKSKGSLRRILPSEDCGDQTSKRSGQGCGPLMQVAKNGKVQRPITKTRGLFHVEMLDEHGRQELEKSKGSLRRILPSEDCGDQTSKRSGQGAGSRAPKRSKKLRNMTLDEWKKKQSAHTVPQACQLRKAGEGIDQSQWADYHPLKKKTLEEPTYEDARRSSSEVKQPRRKKIVVPLQSETRLVGRGGTPEPKSKKQVVVHDHAPSFDESDFPALC